MIVVGYELDVKYNFDSKFRKFSEVIQPIVVIALLGSASSLYLELQTKNILFYY